jgi:D-tyrosyl-tRNA(Tyr) deacylase
VRVLLQRVTGASVSVGDRQIAAIGPGLLALVGILPGDGDDQAAWLAAKTIVLRVFPGAGKPMNRSVAEIGGAVLAVSQFTLAADTRRGNRPGFSGAAAPEQARAIFDRYVEHLRASGLEIATGRFGADMQVALVNDGPVTILLERE